MTTKKVKDVVNLINGYPFSAEDWGEDGYKIIRIQNLNDSSAKYNRTQKNVDDKYYIDLGDILISWAATLGVYEWNDEKAILNQHIYKVQFISDEVLKDYFKYVINIAINDLTYKMRGGGIKHLTKGMLDEYEFVLPDIEEQSKIVSKLNIVQELISHRQKSIKLLDEYLESKFFEMFGDPVLNPKNWNLNNIIFTNGYAFSSKDFVENGIPVLKINDANNFDQFSIDYSFISNDDIDKYSNFIIKNGDIILSLTGTYGKNDYGDCSLVDSVHYNAFLLNQRVAKVSCSNNDYNNFFLYYLLKSNNVKNMIVSSAKGMRQANLSCAVLNEFMFVHPPIEDQNEFSNLYNFVNTLKANYNKTSILFGELFQSLQYNLFNRKEKKDEIDLFIEDELKVDELLKSVVNNSDNTEQQYNLEKDLLFRILERTEKNNKDNKKYLKGLVLKFEKWGINIKTNKEDKFSNNEIN